MSAAVDFRGVRLENLTVGYRRRPAVHHVSFAAPEGALVALVGPNGGGKTTLLRAIAGEIAPLSGRVERGAAKPERAIAYMPQQAAIDRNAPLDVAALVAAGLWRSHGLFGAPKAEERDRVGAALAAVGLAGFERRPLRTLSGGQLQRALFARLMAQDAPILLLDEPFAAVDARTAERLIELLLRWNGEGRTIIASLHDLELVRARFPTTLLLARELIAFGATEEALQPENLLRARRLSEAWREDAPICGAG